MCTFFAAPGLAVITVDPVHTGELPPFCRALLLVSTNDDGNLIEWTADDEFRVSSVSQLGLVMSGTLDDLCVTTPKDLTELFESYGFCVTRSDRVVSLRHRHLSKRALQSSILGIHRVVWAGLILL